MKKTVLTLFATSVLFNFTNAQVSAYPFATTSGTYTAITGGTALGGATDDEQRFVDPATPAGGTALTGVGFPIGFNFTFNGIVFDRLAINTNGWISLGQSSLTPSVNIQSADSYFLPLSQASTATPALLRNRIGALAVDLQSQAALSLRIQTTGSTPNQVCVVQWTNYKKYGTGGTGDSYSFQIRLKETSNTVEVVYGTMTNNATADAPQVGLSGTTESDFNLRKVATSWTSSTAGANNTDTCYLSATVKPASGLTYTWTTPAICSGSPGTTITATGPTGACSGVSFNLVATGYTTGVSGITFQWVSSSTIGGTYSNIVGATTSTYAATQTAATFYKCIVTCSGSGLSTTSNIVTMPMNSPINCYCAATNGGGSCIANVTLGSLNRTSAGCENSPTFYTSVPVGTATTTVNQAQTYPLSVTIDNSSAAILSVWIDYNQNGVFESSEWNQIATNALVSSTSTINIIIPGTATLGQTGMRIRSRGVGSPNGATDACTAMFSGETEDYVITIGAGTACSGTPIAGTASATNDSACSGASFNLILTGYTAGVTGLTFQWQWSATSGGTYANITNATTPTFTTSQTATTYYHCIVTCSGGTPVTSNFTGVILTPFMDCYCASTASNSSDEEILNVTVGTLNNSSTCLTTGGTGSVLNKYSDYTTTVSPPSIGLNAVIPFSVQIGTCGTSFYKSAFKIFIDYNRNGSFADAGESVFTSDTATGVFTKTGTFTVPGGLALGNTLMRVVNTETGNASTIDSCGTYGYGETEDYLVNIALISGISENTIGDIYLYPNPTTGFFNITTNNAKFKEVMISVFDIQGKEVYSVSDKNSSPNYNKQINLEGLAKGLYYIKLNTDAGVKIQKLIIQ